MLALTPLTCFVHALRVACCSLISADLPDKTPHFVVLLSSYRPLSSLSHLSPLGLLYRPLSFLNFLPVLSPLPVPVPVLRLSFMQCASGNRLARAMRTCYS